MLYTEESKDARRRTYVILSNNPRELDDRSEDRRTVEQIPDQCADVRCGFQGDHFDLMLILGRFVFAFLGAIIFDCFL